MEADARQLSEPTAPAAGRTSGRARARRRSAAAADDRAERLLWGAAGVIGTLVAIELIVRIGLVGGRHLPPPSAVMAEATRLVGDAAVWRATLDTLAGWAAAFGLAATAGVLLGLLLGIHPAVRAFTASTIDVLRPIPSVAFIPLVVLLWGNGMGAKIALATYAALWPVVIQVIGGIGEVEQTTRDSARLLRLGPLARLRVVIWPTALPSALTGLRLSASVALIVTVAAELILGSDGLGKAIATAQDAGAIERMYALIVLAGVIGLAVAGTLSGLQSWALRHHAPDRAGRGT